MKPLIETNPYLKDPELRERIIINNVITSCGVEGIKISEEDLMATKKRVVKKAKVEVIKNDEELRKQDKKMDTVLLGIIIIFVTIVTTILFGGLS